MKMGNPRQKMYTNALSKALVKLSEGAIPETEALIAAQGVTKTLLKAGDSLNLKTVNTTAKFIVKQKTRYENGELVYIHGEGVVDQVSREHFEISKPEKETIK